MQETVIEVGHFCYDTYHPWVVRLNCQCQNDESGLKNHGKIIIISRRVQCYDMEAAYWALYGGVPGVRDIANYDYFVFINCGVTDPGARPSKNGPVPWTSHFIQLLDDRVKMTGLNINCERSKGTHIQSMMYAVDKIGLELIMKSGSIFDCLEEPHKNDINYFIDNYERGLSKAVSDAGYVLRPLIGGMVVDNSNLADCVPCGFEF